MEPLAIKSSFAAVAGPDTRVLILGSLPGEASLKQAQYYAHPQNQFWRLVGAVIGRELKALAYPDRLDALSKAGIGLWDVIGSARRRGSLDADIRDHIANPLAAFVATLPALRAVAFNGGKAWTLGQGHLPDRPDLARIALPSSSPAYTIPFETKLAAWRALEAFLG